MESSSKQKFCACCGGEYEPSGRRSTICGHCYPTHRAAYKLFHAAKHRATKAGMAFDLETEWIRQCLGRPCPRTGIPFVLHHSSNKGYTDRHPFGPSLDKIDPFKGYTKDNVQVVCWAYNCAKQRFTDEEVLRLCKAVVKTATS